MSLFDVEDDFPDDSVTDHYLRFKYRLEENLGIGEVRNIKALRLYQKTKAVIQDADAVPAWVYKVIAKKRLYLWK